MNKAPKINVDNILDAVGAEGIIRRTMGIVKDAKAPSKAPVRTEGYAAELKSYRQVTDFLSQQAKDGHRQIYKGHVESLNKVSAQLDGVERNSVNSRHSTYRSLKLDEAENLNAVWLHELFFANCFDPHSDLTMDSLAYMRLQRDWGTFDEWQQDFMACALAAGEGWAVCGYHVFLQRYVNTFIGGNSDNVTLGVFPVIAMDMHSHSYYRDYLNDRKSYLVAMMREFNFEVIEERFKKAEALAEAMK